MTSLEALSPVSFLVCDREDHSSGGQHRWSCGHTTCCVPDRADAEFCPLPWCTGVFIEKKEFFDVPLNEIFYPWFKFILSSSERAKHAPPFCRVHPQELVKYWPYPKWRVQLRWMACDSCLYQSYQSNGPTRSTSVFHSQTKLVKPFAEAYRRLDQTLGRLGLELNFRGLLDQQIREELEYFAAVNHLEVLEGSPGIFIKFEPSLNLFCFQSVFLQRLTDLFGRLENSIGRSGEGSVLARISEEVGLQQEVGEMSASLFLSSAVESSESSEVVRGLLLQEFPFSAHQPQSETGFWTDIRQLLGHSFRAPRARATLKNKVSLLFHRNLEGYRRLANDSRILKSRDALRLMARLPPLSTHSLLARLDHEESSGQIFQKAVKGRRFTLISVRAGLERFACFRESLWQASSWPGLCQAPIEFFLSHPPQPIPEPRSGVFPPENSYGRYPSRLGPSYGSLQAPGKERPYSIEVEHIARRGLTSRTAAQSLAK